MRMVVSDLDGTLLRSDKSISQMMLNILKKMEDKGIVFIIATARPPRTVYNILPFDFKNLYAIYYNGAEIYHGSQLIYNEYIEEITVKNIVEQLEKQYCGINISLEISDHLYTNFNINIMKDWITPYTKINFKEFGYKPAAKILVDLRGIVDITPIFEMLPNSCKMTITDGGTLGQIARMNVSKLNAIKHLANIFGYGLQEVAAFGDDYNDIEMIKECGIGVAMGNAPLEVKDAADIITGTNDEDGVGIELEKIIFKAEYYQP